ncbi:thymidylate synthase [Rhizobium leguminosarum]|uniref:thymidylate synthase n=1 Tax=Rhizobium leguminosarum TaxID=384 RepID=UPI001C988773|nr:thymidylate synthase [Rhizobium leguminosarum]MBY5827104.1 thymidylate synthase [Rhizobium leguminosarum]
MFHASENHIDKLLRLTYGQLLASRPENNRVSSKKGDSTEIFGALLQLTDPRARLSRAMGRSILFSAVGELAWYLAGDNTIAFISHYLGKKYAQFSDDGGITANGAYGKRIFLPREASQWNRVISLLRARPGSRNALIQIFSNDDAARQSNDIPCTCTLHFVVRKDALHLHAHMRSNDAWIGLPHDIFSFTMLQELAAAELGYELGTYQHSVASLHLYDDNEFGPSRTSAKEYIGEGSFEEIAMPAMPTGDPWTFAQEFLSAEQEYRNGNFSFEPASSLPDYWTDLVIISKLHSMIKAKVRSDQYEETISKLHPCYRVLVLDRIDRWAGSDDTAFGILRNF